MRPRWMRLMCIRCVSLVRVERKQPSLRARLFLCCKADLDVDGHTFDAGEAVEQGFGYGRMGVDGEHHLFDGGFELEGGDGFGDDLGGVGAEDVDAEDLAVLCIGDDLDE